MSFSLFIPGVPAPQGSKAQGVGRNGKPFMREDNPRTKPWRKAMVRALQDDHGQPRARFDDAVWVRLRFVFLRPKSHRADSLPTSKALGDVDKLTRNVLDALTQAKVIADDKYVLQLRGAEKVYGPNPGVHIEVGTLVQNPFSAVALSDFVRIDRAQTEAAEPDAQSAVWDAIERAEDRAFWLEALGGGEDHGPVG